MAQIYKNSQTWLTTTPMNNCICTVPGQRALVFLSRLATVAVSNMSGQGGGPLAMYRFTGFGHKHG